MKNIIAPINFDGQAFSEKYSISYKDFSMVTGYLYYDESIVGKILTDEDLLDCVVDMKRRQRILDRESNAKTNGKSILGWSTWDNKTANNWGQTNIGIPLAEVREQLPMITDNIVRAAFTKILDIMDAMYTAQTAQGQMEIAVRDKLWPDLPEGD